MTTPKDLTPGDESPRIQIENVPGGIRLRVGGGETILNGDEAHDLASQLIESAARAGGLDPDEQDWTRVPMQYLCFETEAAPESEDEEDQGGETARAHCWIRGQTRKNAFHVAIGWISEDGWLPTELIEQRSVTREDFEGSEDLQFYEQARIDGEVFKFEIDGPEE